MDRNLLEIERVRLGYTQAEWAQELGMSLSAYKRLITYESNKIDFDMPERFYKLTGKTLFEDASAEIAETLRKLSYEQQHFILNIINFELNFDERGNYVGKGSSDYWESSILREIHRLFNR